ncbi:LytTR family DNA-binding domain-containing protein [Ramlibacter sp.]|uniref:LytR/AlgR family response regulator transcription factor n=1 Tax=Ramlibacter sp. TaxID=1917967 RepID=UPI002BD3184D|nr:LytTR family DNA-binding domain-containing protein [Ramlibacter sp.]HWI83194.1 LytTR family DNA-binding domain-containing protein [Ramlibacter sp.]
MKAASGRLRALVVDDERLLREQLKTRLADVWPDLDVIDEARDGQEALDKAERLQPDVVFLDIRMPGMTGLEAAREIVALPSWNGEIVFVTAYDEYAIAAFEQGALDYLLKPVEPQRLAQTAQRVQARLQAKRPGAAAGGADQAAVDALLAKLMRIGQGIDRGSVPQGEGPLRWIQCSVGSTTRLIDVKDVLFFRSDEKYTRVQTRQLEAFIRTPIRELVPRLDGQQFWQIHRSTLVNLAAISRVTRDDSGRQKVHIEGHPEVLEVSRSFAHLFRSA